MADIHINVAHPVTARVQEVQLTLLHAICELVEEALTREARPGEDRPVGDAARGRSRWPIADSRRR